VNTNNEMVVPKNAHEVGWLDQGPFPGDTQNAVLAGHIKYSGVPGSFGRLTQMRPGDIVVVEIDGKRWEFQVRWTCLFDRQTKLAEQIMGYTDVPSVTLISCSGVFDPVAGTRNKRVAVRAELVRSA
jgi:LPXTG-site transpeptidase (sortase) family protein